MLILFLAKHKSEAAEKFGRRNIIDALNQRINLAQYLIQYLTQFLLRFGTSFTRDLKAAQMYKNYWE